MDDDSRKRATTDEGAQVSKRAKRSKHLNLNDKKLVWKGYETKLPPPNGTAEREMHNFIQRLEENSQPPKLWSDTFGDLLETFSRRPKLELLAQLQLQTTLIPHQDDLIYLQDDDELRDALDRPFSVPLLQRNVKGSKCSLKGLLDQWKDVPESLVSVYDYTIKKADERTRNITVREMCSIFEKGHRTTVLNFLDIENRTGAFFRPTAIGQKDIRARIHDRKCASLGKTNSDWQPLLLKEFFLVSLPDSTSPTHFDGNGYATWILIMEGQKIWYYPRHDTAHTRRWYTQVGTQVPEHFGGWKKMVLQPGDLLVMPPSFLHSVRTSPDPHDPECSQACLAIGGHFYTAALLHQSLEGLKMHEDYPDLCNEELVDSVYNTLGEIIRECDDVTSTKEKASIVSSSSLFRDPLPAQKPKTTAKLSRQNCLDILKSRGAKFSDGDTTETLNRHVFRKEWEECPDRRKFREELKNFRRRFEKQEDLALVWT